jgi:hypothetical protein
MLATLTGPWTPLDPFNHLCRFCQRIVGGECTCGRCSASRASKAANAKHRANAQVLAANIP